MKVRGWLAAGLLAPVLALTAGLYVVPLGVYLVNGFHRFKDGRIEIETGTICSSIVRPQPSS